MTKVRIRLPFIVLAMAVLLVGHQLVYLATYGWRGIERALASVGHDAYWLVIGTAVSVTVVACLLLSVRRWLRLRAALRRHRSARRRGTIDWHVFQVTTLRLVPRLALAALLLFFVQENLEHYLHHGGHVPGVGVLLGPEYVATLPIFIAVAIVVAFVTALLQLGLAALARLVGTIRRRPDRNAPRPAGIFLPIRPRSRSTPDLGRAPPATA